MQNKLLNSHKHYCFHTPRCNVHEFPDLYKCNDDECPVSINLALATQAGLVDEHGAVSCPQCGGTTTLQSGQTIAEIHARLCTDETIHYPEMRRAGRITEEEYARWKATLTRDEAIGVYKRVADIPVMASFTHEETALMKTDLPAFNALVQTRLEERAENALLHQAPHRHKTTTVSL